MLWTTAIDKDHLEWVFDEGEPWLQAYAVGLAEAWFPRELAPELERLAASGDPMVRPLARHVIDGHGENGMAMSSVERAAALRQVELFSGLAADDLLQIASVAEERTFGAGDYLFYEGEEGDYMYLVLKGRIRIEVGGQEVTVVGPGKSPRGSSRSSTAAPGRPAHGRSRTPARWRFTAPTWGRSWPERSPVEGLFSYFTGIIRNMTEELSAPARRDYRRERRQDQRHRASPATFPFRMRSSVSRRTAPRSAAGYARVERDGSLTRERSRAPHNYQ